MNERPSFKSNLFKTPNTGRALVSATIALACLHPLSTLAQVVPEPERQQVEAALPAQAPVRAAKPRKLLIFDLNVNYGGHRSIPTANLAFTLMGQKTGAFETTVSRDPDVFQSESLRQFDAVFFNNTVGNCFTNAELRQNLADFVYAGGGLMGVHGTTVGFTKWPGAIEDWPEFGLMIGARGANHRASDEHVFIKLDDSSHPVNAAFGGKGFDYRDEFFRVGDPYSRHRVRVLMSIDTEKTDLKQGPALGKLERADNDFALAWVRNHGRGRTFYCTIAHNPYVFWDAKMLQFYLAAAQFVLGDLPAPTIPSAWLTPAIRAQEKLGWRLGIEAYSFHKFTLFEAVDKTAALGLPFLGGLSFQRVSKDIPKNFEPGLSDDELRQIRMKLDAAGVRLLTYYIQDIPGDEAGCRKVFEFGRKIGIETFMSEPKLEALDTIERFCDLYDIKVALHNHDQKASPNYWNPEGIMKACLGRSKRLGACADIGYWMRGGIDPIAAVNTLKDRLITVQMHDLNELSPTGHDVPWGSGAGKTEQFIKEMHRLGLKPTMSYNDYRELIARPDIDAVLIATPDHWHTLASCDAAAAGKDVYCEKPVSLTIQEGRKLVEAVRRNGCVFQTGTQYRSIPTIRQVCEFVRRGGLGHVKQVFTSWFKTPVPTLAPSYIPLDPSLPAEPVPEGLDWDLWVGPATWRPYNAAYHRNPPPGVVPWVFCDAFGAGAITGYQSHAADVIQYALGMETNGPVEIFHPSSSQFPTLTFRYANGTLLHHVDDWGQVKNLYHAVPPNARLAGLFGGIFVGERGWVTSMSTCGPIEASPATLFDEMRLTSREVNIGGNNHHSNWFECMRTRAHPSSHEEIGHRSASLGHLATISYTLERSLKWNSSAEEFSGDAAANRLRSRAMREPWRV